MVLYIWKWNIRPEKAKAYLEWAKGAIARALAVPGLVELRGYRPAAGDYQAVMTFEFADLAGWEAWYGAPDVQAAMLELRAFTTDLSVELWGPSPVIPGPIRPRDVRVSFAVTGGWTLVRCQHRILSRDARLRSRFRSRSVAETARRLTEM